MPAPFSTCVDQFLGDPKVLGLLDLARETRPLRICYPGEVPVSRFLAWILDSTEGHGLGDVCIRSLLGEAWRKCESASLSTSTKHSLLPTTVAAQSFESCLVKREAKLDGKLLDVLILDPQQKWLLAVENKFGARESTDQLKRYRSSLERQFPDWTRILVFLDVFGQPPSDAAWIGLDYGWLIEEIQTAENSPWLGAASKAALAEFRAAIEPSGDTFVHIDVNDEKLLQVIDRHRVVFERMKTWLHDHRPISERIVELYGESRSQDQRASQQLFQAYWQRRRLWEVCIPMLLYAGLLNSIKRRFPSIEHNPKRKAFYFYLPEWMAFARLDTANPVYVMVRILPPTKEGGAESFVVVSFIDTTEVGDNAIEKVMPIVEQLRKTNLAKNRRIKESRGRLTLRIDRAEVESTVQAHLTQHVQSLQNAFRSLV